MTADCQTLQCLICGDYLTMNDTEAERRCTDPAHWVAAGLLAKDDFYHMAQLMAAGRTSRPLPVSCDTTRPARMAGRSSWPAPVHQFLSKLHK